MCEDIWLVIVIYKFFNRFSDSLTVFFVTFYHFLAALSPLDVKALQREKVMLTMKNY